MMCIIDGKFEDSEREILIRISNIFNISNEFLNNIITDTLNNLTKENNDS